MSLNSTSSGSSKACSPWKRRSKPLFGSLRVETPWLAKLVFLSAFAVLYVSACTHQNALSGRGAEDVKRSLLHEQQVRFHGRLFFVGLAWGPTLEAATQSAYNDIAHQLGWLPASSQTILQGIRVERSVPDSQGNIHLLATLEREFVARELRRLAQEKQTQLHRDMPLCESRILAGEMHESRQCLQQLKAKLDLTRDLLAAAQTALGEPERAIVLSEIDTWNKLNAVFHKQCLEGRTVMLGVFRAPGETPDITETLSRSVTQSGMKLLPVLFESHDVERFFAGDPSAILKRLRQEGVGYAVLGHIRSQFSEALQGQFFSMASGVLRVLRTTDGKILKEMSLENVKGGHLSKQKATEKATQHLAERLCDLLLPYLQKLNSDT